MKNLFKGARSVCSARVIGVALVALTLSACDDDDDGNSSRQEGQLSIVEVATDDGSFTTLLSALEATGLDMVLSDEEQTFTVFAPTDAAFEKLGDDTINTLLADTDTLSDILLYHVVAEQEIDAEAAVGAAGTTITMANEDPAAVSQVGDDLFLNLSEITATDIEAENGIIHVLDTVLIPPVEEGVPIDNLVETAIAAGTFTTLVTALEATGLDATLADETATFTVFAPTDDAFALLGNSTITALLGDTEALSAILLQHVVSGAAVDSVSAYAAAGTNITTAGGAEVLVSIEGNQLTVGGATVETTDIYTVNGVIHVIDMVIQ